ncbi:hypothetical protein AB0L33_24545 [Streptomyces sp. NPDC052299]|uniref:hypothetical protein n=1 Tax=Streptomyces sp. NPDC052299 TaxID=3155054 RepID=UPI0034425F30
MSIIVELFLTPDDTSVSLSRGSARGREFTHGGFSRCERAQLARLDVQEAIRDARTRADTAVVVQVHKQAVTPAEYLEGRTTDPATWLRTPRNLERPPQGRGTERNQ